MAIASENLHTTSMPCAAQPALSCGILSPFYTFLPVSGKGKGEVPFLRWHTFPRPHSSLLVQLREQFLEVVAFAQRVEVLVLLYVGRVLVALADGLFRQVPC